MHQRMVQLYHVRRQWLVGLYAYSIYAPAGKRVYIAEYPYTRLKKNELKDRMFGKAAHRPVTET